MNDDAYPSVRIARRPGKRRLRGRLCLTVASAILGFTAWGHFAGPDEGQRAASVLRTPAVSPVREAAVTAASGTYAWMLDPAPALGGDTPRLGQDRSLGSTFRPAPVRMAAIPEPVAAPVDRERARIAPSQMLAARLVQAVPLPMPRPPELRRPRPADVQRLAARPVQPRTQTVFRAAIGEERSFFDTLFGGEPSAGGNPLAYAGVESGAAETASRRRLSPVPSPSAGGLTAIYDISARTVSLPNGDVIEAHSGLGGSMDDPRYVHLSMRGATPPGTYDLTEREALFHGVRALRLNPVGGSGAIHGRVGLLAHTYMLGPSGASNGCVSFKNYDRFLQAFLRGEVRRLVVVAGNLQDGPPGSGNGRLGFLGRPSRNGG